MGARSCGGRSGSSSPTGACSPSPRPCQRAAAGTATRRSLPSSATPTPPRSTFEEALLSTEYGEDGVQRRATLELWPDAEEMRPLRGAGTLISSVAVRRDGTRRRRSPSSAGRSRAARASAPTRSPAQRRWLKIKAVVSDFGGVLTTPLFAAFAAFQDEVGISPENLGKAMRAGLAEGEDLPLFQLERGEISEDSVPRAARRRAGIAARPPPRTCTASARSSSGALAPERGDDRADARAEGERPADGDADQQRARVGAALAARCCRSTRSSRTIVDSAFVGCRKPEARIYELTLERLGLPAEECLFIDDLEPNIEGAEAARLQRGPLPRQRAGDRRDPRRARLDGLGALALDRGAVAAGPWRFPPAAGERQAPAVGRDQGADLGRPPGALRVRLDRRRVLQQRLGDLPEPLDARARW